MVNKDLNGGVNSQINIETVHRLCLDMAKEMHRICEEHDIPYFMVGGSLLGAVRHKGFIPWDDDMDFDIPREHYAKAIEVFRKELKSPYRLITYEDSDICLDEACKIMDTRTIVHQDDAYHKDNLGVFIDIFPLDYSDGKTGLFSNYMLLRTLVRIQSFRFTHVKDRIIPLKFFSYVVKALFWGLKRTTIPNLVKNKLIQHKGEYRISYCGLYGRKEVFPAKFLHERKLMQFEDTQLYGVVPAHDMLSHVYGDYMQLPPEDQRHIHLLDIQLLEGSEVAL